MRATSAASDRVGVAWALLIVAFEGWNDAGAATGVTRGCSPSGWTRRDRRGRPRAVLRLPVHAPTIQADSDGVRRLTWPGAAILGPSGCPRPPTTSSSRDRGRAPPAARGEPAASRPSSSTRRCRRTSRASSLLGAMLADAPHTRPLAVFASSENEVPRRAGVSGSTYEGPVGILSVIADQAERVGIPTVSLWASVPHYVHNAPSPRRCSRSSAGSRTSPASGPARPSRTRRRPGGERRRARGRRRGDGRLHPPARAGARRRSTRLQASGEAIAQEFERHFSAARRPAGQAGRGVRAAMSRLSHPKLDPTLAGARRR